MPTTRRSSIDERYAILLARWVPLDAIVICTAAGLPLAARIARLVVDESGT